MSKLTFKERLKQLLQEGEKLIKETPDEELEAIGIQILKEVEKNGKRDAVVCVTHKEFNQRMLERISGVPGEYAYILIHHYDYSEAKLDAHRKAAKEHNRYFVLPTIVSAPTRLGSKPEEYPQDYLAILTHDKKVLIVPTEGEAFSDVEFPIGDEDDFEDDESGFF